MVTKLSHEQLSALRRIDSPTVSNAIETFQLRPRVAGYVGYDIRCIFSELPPTVGYAVTCTVDSTTEGRQGIGTDRLHSCHAGEIMSTRMKRLGAIGILTDGGLRDVREVRALGGFQYFCAGLVVSHGNPVCVDVGGEVTISGMRVCTGDLLHGDVNGVVHIPDECVDQVAEAAYRIWAEEGETLRRITSPEFTTTSGPEVKH